MKKRFNLYLIAWAVALALFNVISFVSVEWAGYEKYTSSFWIGYVFISVTLVGQLACAYVALKAENAQKTFYNISLLRTSYVGLIVSFIIGGVCMMIPVLPYWAGVIVCAIVLAVNVLSVLKATAAIDEVERIDVKIKAQTFFIKSLRVDAETLMAQAGTDAIKADCRKVCEAIRYSDPMSNNALSALEGQITVKFAGFSDAVKVGDADKSAELANDILILINDRNKKCMLLK